MRAWPRRHGKLPALPLRESTHTGAQVARSAIAQEDGAQVARSAIAQEDKRRAVRGKPRSGVKRRITPHPSRHATCARSAQDRGGKPSPARGEGEVVAGCDIGGNA
jgi:hypothetical protein